MLRRSPSRDAPELATGKRYFKIGEAAAIVGVPAHVLRFWEGEFRALRPEKSGGRQRVYSRADIDLLLKIRQLLYTEKFTIAGARLRLEGPPEAVSAAPPAPRYQAERSLAALQAGLRELRALVERGGDPELDADPMRSLRQRAQGPVGA